MEVSLIRRFVTRRRNVFIVLALALMAFILVTSNASAYTLWPYGYQSRTIPIDRVTYVGAAYLVPAVNAQNSWNSARIGITITHPGVNKLYTGYRYDSWFGKYDVQLLGGPADHKATKFEIQINTRQCDALSAVGKQSVVAHELGHAIGLYEGNVANMLMWNGRDHNAVYVPKSDDKIGAVDSWN